MLDVLLGAAGPDRVDREALAAAVTSLGALLAAVPELHEIEINPLRATSDGRLVALDVVVSGVAGPGTAAVGVGVGGVAETGTLDGAVAVSDAVTHPPDVAASSGANHPPTVSVRADGQGGH
jgi:hypothetical protein